MTAPTPPEVQEARVVEEVARAMCDSDAEALGGDLWEQQTNYGREQWLRIAAAAVAAYRAAQDGGAEEAEYTGPCVFCQHPAPGHDVDGECWAEGCACGTGEANDPQAER